MTPADRIAQIEALFHRARVLPVEERDEWLDAECGQDVELADAVRQLLRQGPAEETWRFAISGLPAEALEPATVPATIGPYRIGRELGRGGMGAVYAAEQEHPVRRQVALKVIRPGEETESMLSRFERERRALATMNHDSIARLYDCGATSNGQPYFAMELVEGEPITTFVEQRALSRAQRVALFLQVCEGIQHAHRAGVFHRDLKPSNVLATEKEGRISAKIIDFGVSHAISEGSGSADEVAGTIGYISPEQLAGKASEVGPQTDVYSLGVLLFVLLCGERSGQGEPTSEPCPLRPRAVDGRVPAILDAIAARATEPDPARRYPSVDELREDLERYAAGLPPRHAHAPLLAALRTRVTYVLGRPLGVAALIAVLLTSTVWITATMVREELTRVGPNLVVEPPPSTIFLVALQIDRDPDTGEQVVIPIPYSGAESAGDPSPPIGWKATRRVYEFSWRHYGRPTDKAIVCFANDEWVQHVFEEFFTEVWQTVERSDFLFAPTLADVTKELERRMRQEGRAVNPAGQELSEEQLGPVLDAAVAAKLTREERRSLPGYQLSVAIED